MAKSSVFKARLKVTLLQHCRVRRLETVTVFWRPRYYHRIIIIIIIIIPRKVTKRGQGVGCRTDAGVKVCPAGGTSVIAWEW